MTRSKRRGCGVAGVLLLDAVRAGIVYRRIVNKMIAELRHDDF